MTSPKRLDFLLPQGEYYLVGNTKAPVNFREAGFEPPDEVELVKGVYLRLKPLRGVKVAAPVLVLDVEGEELARKLVQRFVIDRNGSMSERLWRFVYSPDDPLDDAEAPVERDARWLGDIPETIWQLVRDNVLRCLQLRFRIFKNNRAGAGASSVDAADATFAG